MKKFVNKYLYTPEIARTAILIWWWNKYRAMLLICIGMLAGFGCTALLRRDAAWLIPGSLGIFGILMFLVRALQAVRQEQNKVQKAFHVSAPMMRVELGEEIRTVVSNSRSQVSPAQLVGYRETKELLILLLRGNMTLPLKKDAFEKGTAEECKTWAESVIADNKKAEKTGRAGR
ncbi:MAG: YcxB family protein [Eubacteriales bacterium]|nr:YcxB family protein [Eubacteriales bacterium]